MNIEVRGETFQLLPERALFWPRHRLLVIADLHLGKAEVFQRQGLWLPSQANTEDLNRLQQIADRVEAKEILFLGDLVHSSRVVPGEIEQIFASWSQNFKGRVTVVLGNHDRGLNEHWPKSWSEIDRVEMWESDQFRFQHEPPTDTRTDRPYTWVGHVHPVVRLSTGADRLRLPCFALAPDHGLIPAFSSLAGGYEIKPAKDLRLFATADQNVIPIGRTH